MKFPEEVQNLANAAEAVSALDVFKSYLEALIGVPLFK